MSHSRGILLCLSFSLVVSPALLQAVEKAHVQSNAATASDLALKAEKEKLATAHAHFLTARMLEDEGRMREALGHYLAFLRGSMGEPELVAHIAELALDYQGLEAAVALLEESIKANPERAEPFANFMQFALTHSDEKNALLPRAAALAEEAVKKFPTSAESYVAAVRLHLAEALRTKRELGGEADKHREAAHKVLDLALKQNVPDPAFWMELGRIALEVWPLADSENRAAHMAKVDPFFERAIQRAQAAKDEGAELRVADFYLFSNQIDKAAAICEGAVKRTGSLDSRKRLVRLYEALERPADSFKALEELVEAYPRDVEHRRLIALIHVQRGENAFRALKFDEEAAENLKAVGHLEAALQAGGGDVDSYLEISNLLRRSEQPDQFERFTLRAHQLYPGEPRTSFYRALALMQVEKFADASKAYEESAKLAETRLPELLNYEFHFRWGEALERGGDIDGAAKQFQKSIDLTPPENLTRGARAMNYLGYMWLDRGMHLDRAETLIRKALEMDPENGAYLDSLGWLLFKQGKYAEALKELQNAEKRLREEIPEPTPGDAEIYDHIAQTYDKMGQRDQALGYWKRALDVKPEIDSIRERAERELGISQPKPTKPALPPEEEKKPAAGPKKS
jgi:tetratricopeptide (TPR) repeat protein